jgi:PAS domain S-box-containing protein
MTDFRSSDGPTALQLAAVQQLPDAVMVLDSAGRIAVWNRAAERLFRLAAGDAIGRTPTEVNVYPWLTPDAEPEAARALDAVGTWRGTALRDGRSGHVAALESTLTALTGADGGPGGILAVVRDVTDARRELLQQLEGMNPEPCRAKHPELSTGHIPICAHCKRIREADGTWREVEIYLGRHLQLRFSHGICPICLRLEAYT